MNLPNAAQAIVSQAKILEYLLNAAHPDNGGKAAFFLSLGFRPEDWQALAAGFCDLARTFPVTKKVESLHGTKYILDGQLKTPGGKRPLVRTVWVVDSGLEGPRLVTAYPHPN